MLTEISLGKVKCIQSLDCGFVSELLTLLFFLRELDLILIVFSY